MVEEIGVETLSTAVAIVLDKVVRNQNHLYFQQVIVKLQGIEPVVILT